MWFLGSICAIILTIILFWKQFTEELLVSDVLTLLLIGCGSWWSLGFLLLIFSVIETKYDRIIWKNNNDSIH